MADKFQYTFICRSMCNKAKEHPCFYILVSDVEIEPNAFITPSCLNSNYKWEHLHTIPYTGDENGN